MTTTFAGKFYSGVASSSNDVIVCVDDCGYLTIEGLNEPPVPLWDMSISLRVGNSSRYLEYLNGGKIETRANDEIDRLQKLWIKPCAGYTFHELEGNRVIMIIAVLVLFIGSYSFVTFGVPALSVVITASLPTSLDDHLGGEVLERLDRLTFEPSRLPPEQKDELRVLFKSVIPDDRRNYRLSFRYSELLGANALALPDAQIILTDQLVEISDDHDMIGAIMLHEIGHVVGRHSMQAAVRQAGLSLAILALTGDINSVSGMLALLLPTVLIQLQYSRELEWEADTYALNQMYKHGVNPNKFADMMEKLIASQQEERDEDEFLFRYFSTHPVSVLRIERFREAGL